MNRARPTAALRSTLFVALLAAAQASLLEAGAAAIEVQHASPQLIERINTYFGHRAIRQLRLLQLHLPPVAAPMRTSA